MRTNVEAPALRRQRNGLLSVANVVDVGDARWEDGINFTPRGCSVIFGHDTKCWFPRGNKALQECPPVAQFYPYVLEATLTWHTADLNAGPKEILKQAFDYGTSSALARLMEQEIADVADDQEIPVQTVQGNIRTGGIQGRRVGTDIDSWLPNPHLMDGLPIGSVTSALDAIGSVEAKLLDAADHTGSAGTIYMSPIIAALGWGALTVEGENQIYTLATGCRVVIDNFGQPNVYGHLGEVDVYLGDVDIVDVVEHSANEYIVQAERMAVAVWNPCATFFRPAQATISTGGAAVVEEVIISPDQPTDPNAELWYDPDTTR